MSDEIVFELRRHIAVLRINRPASRNALNWAAQEQFAAAVSVVSRMPEARVLVVTGTGARAFVAGGDLKELGLQPDKATGLRLYEVMGRALVQLTELPIPVIAAVNGDTFGGGCEILTACDLRLAVPQARFSFAQVGVGLTTGWGGAGRLVRLVGQSKAMELLLTGRIITADEAQQLGLIHRLLPEDREALEVALEWAEQLATLPRAALAATKTLVHGAAQGNLEEAYELESRLFLDLWAQADHLEALQAFLEKRRPIFNRE